MEYLRLLLLSSSLLPISLPLPAEDRQDPCFSGFDNFEECWGEKVEEFCSTEVRQWPRLLDRAQSSEAPADKDGLNWIVC